jgi:nitrogen-specific signal transduction histidine kinase
VEPMIKKLRTKFIILSSFSLLLLLGIIVISSNFLTYKELVGNADMVLERLNENGGRPSLDIQPPQIADNKKPEDQPKNNDIISQNDIGWRNAVMSPEAMYEARFFIVNISKDGRISSVNTDNIAMVDQETAKTYGQSIYSKNKTKGFVGDFRFLKTENENGCNIMFLDCGRNLSTFKIALCINVIISFIGLIIIIIIIVICSKKIVRPVSESYEKQKQFISIAGHEIKTPITIIDADAELLSMEIGEDNEWLQDICTQTKRMATLTNDLLSLSRMDENRQQFTMIDFPISDVVEETIVSFRTLARSKGKNIKADITPMLSYNGDESSIRQVVGILLDNAIKYARPDKDIEVKLEKKNKNIIITVTNSSEYVSDEQLRQFFDRFYRTEQSNKSGTGGYGLGLSIAKSIVEKHKGKINATAPTPETVQITVVLG